MCMRVTETFIIKYMSPIWSTRLEQRLGSVHLYWLFALPQAVRSLDIERMWKTPKSELFTVKYGVIESWGARGRSAILKIQLASRGGRLTRSPDSFHPHSGLLQVQEFQPVSMTPQGIGKPEDLCFPLIFSQWVEAKLEGVKVFACSISIRVRELSSYSATAPFQVAPDEATGNFQWPWGKTREQGFFVSFSGHLISFLCFI